MEIFRSSVLFVLMALTASAQDKYPVDWAKTNPEFYGYFAKLIGFDTTNPPGNETPLAEYLKSVLEANGIPANIYALEPKRGNVVARLKGNGSKRPILLMGHLDTVGLQREKWLTDPFVATRKDGYIYGRGANDDRDNLASSLMTMILLKRSGVKLDRDVIFVAEAGEESSPQFGIEFLIAQHWLEIEAEYAIAEGGYVGLVNGKHPFVLVSTTEKVPRALRLVAHGTAGHGSLPKDDNPVLRIAGAIARFRTWQPPVRFSDTTRAFFERLAAISDPAARERFNHPGDAASQDYFLKNQSEFFSISRTSVVPTIINAGFKNNVIPSDAEALLDCRLLPDEDLPKFIATIKQVIDDPAIEVLPPPPGGRPFGTPSPLDSDHFLAMERTTKRLFPGAVTLPGMFTAASDLAQLRAKGVKAYGIGPISEKGGVGEAHIDNERVLEEGLYKLLQYHWFTVLDVAASK